MDVGFFYQSENGIRDVERSRGLGDVYRKQAHINSPSVCFMAVAISARMVASHSNPPGAYLPASQAFNNVRIFSSDS